MRSIGVLIAIASGLIAASAEAAIEADPPIPPEIVEGIADARLTLKKFGGSVWPGLSEAPSGFLFVDENREVLLCDDRTPEGFREAVVAPGLDCKQSVGPKSWRRSNLLAAMPAFGPPSVIVMGSPEATGRSFADWKVTIFHENFHQFQAALPDYYARVKALDLDGGDETGMWMLNFPFPYARSEVATAHSKAARALADALRADEASLPRKMRTYLKARARFAASVTAAEWRYFEFQLWQEGVARWTEMELAERSQHTDKVAVARRLREEILASLAAPDLAKDERIAVYAFGAAEAMLLERATPNWKECYGTVMALGPMLHGGCDLRAKIVR